MDQQRKKAYRYLLYYAMLDIRSLAWMSFGGFRLLNPFFCRHVIQRIHRAGVIANWLHNLAQFSALEFERFDEEWFWREFWSYAERYPAFHLATYAELFEQQLARPGQIKCD